MRVWGVSAKWAGRDVRGGNRKEERTGKACAQRTHHLAMCKGGGGEKNEAPQPTVVAERRTEAGGSGK
jgi:hypothetical protein